MLQPVYAIDLVDDLLEIRAAYLYRNGRNTHGAEGLHDAFGLPDR
jgi:hypothetical protein